MMGIMREVVGLCPYEKRCVEILRINATKRAKKFLRKRLGSQRAGRRKMAELQNIMAEQNRRQMAEEALKKEAGKSKSREKKNG